MRVDHRARAALVLALLASAGLHIGVLRGLSGLELDLDVDFELALPAEIEFGITESMEVASAPAAASPAESSPPPGGAPDGFTSDEPDEQALAEAAEAGEEASGDEGDEERRDDPANDEGSLSSLDGPTSLPPGAQLAMRLDMKRIARSPLAPTVRDFFRKVPDWHLIVHGSEIDPLTDVDRLFLATPDPRRRSELVIAGRVTGGEPEIRRAVEHMAASRGEPTSWRSAQGLEVADWRNLDDTARVMALLGPRQFAIAREAVLPTVLAMTQHRGARARAEGLDASGGADALLSMGPNDALSLEVEGLHRYVRGRLEHLPTRARLAIGEASGGGISVEGLAFFGSAEEATAAQAYWERIRQQLANQPWLRIFGMGSALDGATLVADGDRVRIRAELTHRQARQVLDYVAAQIAAMTGFRPPTPTNAPAPISPPPPTPSTAPTPNPIPNTTPTPAPTPTPTPTPTPNTAPPPAPAPTPTL